MTHFAKYLLIVLFICQTVNAADGPFVSRTFEEACAEATAQGKVVFVDFYTTWCGPCKIMDATAFADGTVVTWLKENTIAIKVDAEKDIKLSAKYGIDTYPTFLFTKPDGTEMGRLVGASESEPFLAEAKAILTGKDPMTRAKDRLTAAGENDPMARMAFARELVQMGKHKEALEAFLWCFDEGNKHSIAFLGVRLSFLVSDIARLGRVYPPALDALRERRDAARECIIHEEPKDPTFLTLFSTIAHMPASEFASLNKALGEERKTLELYDQMRVEHPDWRVVEQLRDMVFELLLEAKRYAEIAESTNIVEKIEERIALDKEYERNIPEAQRAEILAMDKRMMREEIGRYYEALVGAGKLEDARKLSNIALDLDGSAGTYNDLAWHGYLTGKPTEENEAQARKAFEMTDGKSAAVIDTLVRILDARGKKQEACNIAQEAAKLISSPPDQAVLRECIDDLGCGVLD